MQPLGFGDIFGLWALLSWSVIALVFGVGSGLMARSRNRDAALWAVVGTIWGAQTIGVSLATGGINAFASGAITPITVVCLLLAFAPLAVLALAGDASPRRRAGAVTRRSSGAARRRRSSPARTA